jgi:tetratricopeptide (TPR) repeat protein
MNVVAEAVVLALCLAPVGLAEQGVLAIHVSDTQKRPISGVQLATEGDGSVGSPTDAAGKTRIRLAPQTRPQSWITLQIVKSSRDLVFISPWDGRAQVPSFENESENYARIVMAPRGDRALLESKSAVLAIAARFNSSVAPTRPNQSATDDGRRAALTEVSKDYGLQPVDVDHAIRSLGERTTNSYEKGVAALYAKDYLGAANLLSESLRTRQADQAEAKPGDAAFFLGESLYEQGRYLESAEAYRIVARLRPDDTLVLNNLGLSLTGAGRQAEAEPVFRRALEIREKTFGPEHPGVSISLNNLGMLLYAKHDLDAAEQLFRRAGGIDEKVLGPESTLLATDLNNLAVVLLNKGDLAGAEPPCRRALQIRYKSLGPDAPDFGNSLDNLATILYSKGDVTGALPLYRQSLAIRRKALGAEHPDVATSMYNLGEVLRRQGSYAEAESLLRGALAIREKILGPKHPAVADSLNSLAVLILYSKQDFVETDSLLKRALAIDEKNLGTEHPTTVNVRNNLKMVESSSMFTVEQQMQKSK